MAPALKSRLFMTKEDLLKHQREVQEGRLRAEAETKARQKAQEEERRRLEEETRRAEKGKKPQVSERAYTMLPRAGPPQLRVLDSIEARVNLERTPSQRSWIEWPPRGSRSLGGCDNAADDAQDGVEVGEASMIKNQVAETRNVEPSNQQGPNTLSANVPSTTEPFGESTSSPQEINCWSTTESANQPVSSSHRNTTSATQLVELRPSFDQSFHTAHDWPGSSGSSTHSSRGRFFASGTQPQTLRLSARVLRGLSMTDSNEPGSAAQENGEIGRAVTTHDILALPSPNPPPTRDRDFAFVGTNMTRVTLLNPEEHAAFFQAGQSCVDDGATVCADSASVRSAHACADGAHVQSAPTYVDKGTVMPPFPTVVEEEQRTESDRRLILSSFLILSLIWLGLMIGLCAYLGFHHQPLATPALNGDNIFKSNASAVSVPILSGVKLDAVPSPNWHFFSHIQEYAYSLHWPIEHISTFLGQHNRNTVQRILHDILDEFRKEGSENFDQIAQNDIGQLHIYPESQDPILHSFLIQFFNFMATNATLMQSGNGLASHTPLSIPSSPHLRTQPLTALKHTWRLNVTARTMPNMTGLFADIKVISNHSLDLTTICPRPKMEDCKQPPSPPPPPRKDCPGPPGNDSKTDTGELEYHRSDPKVVFVRNLITGFWLVPIGLGTTWVLERAHPGFQTEQAKRRWDFTLIMAEPLVALVMAAGIGLGTQELIAFVAENSNGGR